MEKFALISVYDKSNLKFICEFFHKNNIKIISTGTTAKFIKKIGYRASTIKDILNFKEILDGRVKTLHPQIFASLLYNNKSKKHVNEFSNLKFPDIEYLIVNFYPFKKTVLKKLNIQKCIEMIDIGGPSLLRAASKNFTKVASICDPADYTKLIKNYNDNKNKTSLKFRKEMATKSFKTTFKYDMEIYEWFENKKLTSDFIIKNHNKVKLKYGENSHQNSVLFKNGKNNFFDNQIHGKELGFNNLRDIDSAFNCLNEFNNPTSVIIKHNSPCGAASSTNIYNAFRKSVLADPISAFGGIIALNRVVNVKTALSISKNFYEVLLAPNFKNDALKILKKNKNLIIIKTAGIHKNLNKEVFTINKGYLVQDFNKIKINRKIIKLVSNYKTTEKRINDLIFAFKICKHVKSNAIVLVNNSQTIAIGGGQSNRLESAKIAINKIQKKSNFVVASDAFFPFTDCIKILIKKNCKAILKPSGSINDVNIIKFANDKKLSLYFSNYRLFKH